MNVIAYRICYHLSRSRRIIRSFTSPLIPEERPRAAARIPPPPPHGQSINVIKVDPPANLHQQPEHSEENTKTQAFPGLGHGKRLPKNLQTPSWSCTMKRTDNNSSPSSRGPVKGASDQGDTPGSDMQQHVLKGQQSAKDKESSSVQSSENQIENISSPPFHVQRCVLCLLCFKDSEDFLAHLKQSHSGTDYFSVSTMRRQTGTIWSYLAIT